MNTCLSAASITNMLALVVRWFRRKRSKATALAACGTSIGGLLTIPFAAYLMGVIDSSGITWGDTTLAGWRTVWFLLGMVVVFAAAPLAVFFLRPSPAEMGLNPDGDPDPRVGSGGAPVQRATGAYEVDSWRQCFKTAPMWQLSGAYVVCGITTGLLSIHFIPYAEDVLPAQVNFLGGVWDEKVFAGLVFGVMTGLNAFGVIITGFLGDRMRRKNVLAAVYATRGVAFMCLVFPAAVRPRDAGADHVRAAVGNVLGRQRTADIHADRGRVRVSGHWGRSAAGCSSRTRSGRSSASSFAGYAYVWFNESYFWPFLIAGLTLIPATIMAFSINEYHYSGRYNTAPAPQLATAGAGAGGGTRVY